LSMLNHSPLDTAVLSLRPLTRETTIIPKSILLLLKDMQKDPVCGMMVDERRAKLTSEHDGQKFYFCSAGCKIAFDKDPRRYAH